MTTKRTSTNTENHANRVSHLRWVPIVQMRISPNAQQKFQQSHAERLATNFDLEALGYPVVSHRDGHFYVIDGQHRIAALKLIGYGDQSIQCECYEGLTEEGEAELFLQRNSRREPPAFEKFRIAVFSGREMQSDIDRVIRTNGAVISQDRVPGAIRCVGTLERIYRRGGAGILGRSVRLSLGSYGDAGLEAAVLDGLALLAQRYNGTLSDEVAVKKLGNVNGGVNGLLNRAETLRLKTGNAKGQCVAAAAVEIINAGASGGRKLPSWWKS